MLVLSRRSGEAIVLPGLGVVITIREIRSNQVRVGITAPATVEVHRREVWDRIRRQGPALGAGVPDRGGP